MSSLLFIPILAKRDKDSEVLSNQFKNTSMEKNEWINGRENREEKLWYFLISCLWNSISHTIISTIWSDSNGVLFAWEESAGVLTAAGTSIYFLFEDFKFSIMFSAKTTMGWRINKWNLGMAECFIEKNDWPIFILDLCPHRYMGRNVAGLKCKVLNIKGTKVLYPDPIVTTGAFERRDLGNICSTYSAYYSPWLSSSLSLSFLLRNITPVSGVALTEFPPSFSRLRGKSLLLRAPVHTPKSPFHNQ